MPSAYLGLHTGEKSSELLRKSSQFSYNIDDSKLGRQPNSLGFGDYRVNTTLLSPGSITCRADITIPASVDSLMQMFMLKLDKVLPGAICLYTVAIILFFDMMVLESCG